MSDFQALFPSTTAAFKQGLDQGLHVGVQACILLGGHPPAELALGRAGPDAEMTMDVLMPWFSCTKPLVAVAVAQLWEQGRWDWDDFVAEYIPEFGVKGKEAVTLRHLLTHTCGFRWVETGWPQTSWEEVIQRICDAPLEPRWVVGHKAGYHPFTSWYILGELIRRAGGEPADVYVCRHVLEPLGMKDTWLAMSPERCAAYGRRIGVMFQTTGGEPTISTWSEAYPRACDRCVPGASGVGPMRDLARFYQMLLQGGELDGRRVLRSETVQVLTSRQRVGMFDASFRHGLDWGLGFIIDSNRYGPDTVPYGFGRFCSEQTFGHGGRESSIGFVDPQHDLVVAWVCNGMPGEPAHHERNREINSAIYEDLAWMQSRATSMGVG